MNIAMIGQKGYPPQFGGVERHVAELSTRLVQAGHTVTVYNRAWYGGRINETIDGIHIKTLPTLRTKHLDAIVHTFNSTIHAIYTKADIIHYHGVGPALLSWIPRVFSRANVITTFHCIDRHHQKWNWFARFMLRIGEQATCTFAHKTITVSRGLQQYCRNEYIKETAHIPNGVAVRTHTGSIDTTLLDTFGLSRDNYILMVSRLVPHKGAHVLIEAFQKLKQAMTDTDTTHLKLAIVGGSAYTDDYVASLHTQAGSSNDIIFTDYQSGDTLDTLFRGASFVVHPSTNEGLPIAVLEAMSYGKTIIVSNIPEHLEVVKDTQMHFVENNVDSLVEKLRYLLSMSPEEKNERGATNQAYVEKEYDWNAIVGQTIELYEKDASSSESTSQSLPVTV